MEQYDNNFYIRTCQDPARRGNYQVELEGKVTSNVEPIGAALESSGYRLADFDQWGLTYLSREYPDLWIDLDELDEYCCKTRLVLHKDRLFESKVDIAKECLERIYHQIINKITPPHKIII